MLRIFVYTQNHNLTMSIKRLFIAAAGLCCLSCGHDLPREAFLRVEGERIVTPAGEPFVIKGTNLGNWLNPEGYMFGFGRTNSARWIDEMFRQAVGPDCTDAFWRRFKENYVTQADIRFIASTGANTVRIPFHYKLFTPEDYMGMNDPQEGFRLLDRVIGWCREAGLYVILDMHDAPGGQTGDNIDDSYGYPWLFESEASQRKFCEIWRAIAAHYRNEPQVLGYELINEPIAPYFNDMEELNARLEPLHKRAVAAIREADPHHIVLLGGAQWNGNFELFRDWGYDRNIMYTCHRYGGDPTAEAIRSILDFRNRTGLPMYMGEIGHNTPEWMHAFCRTMDDNGIGWTFWPYKKIGDSSFVGFDAPEGWDEVVRFAESPRTSYAEIRSARPDPELARRAMEQLLENVRFENCRVQEEYIGALTL